MIKKLFMASRDIETDKAAFVMGIVNCTPDSFWAGGRANANSAMRMIEEGADILDIGGESTRPGAEYIDEEEEIKRIIPVLKEIRKNSNIPISIDTRKHSVFLAAWNEGADILNDVSALEDDEKSGGRLSDFAAKHNVPVILMHKRGVPGTMQNNTKYNDVFQEVSGYLARRANYAVKCGINKNRIIADPGIGFGKDTNANALLIRRCGQLCGGEYPVLVGLSRKSCIGEMTGREIKDRLIGSIAGISVAAMNGAAIVRVHDVAESVDAMKVVSVCGGVKGI